MAANNGVQSEPVAKASPRVQLKLSALDGSDQTDDIGYLCKQFEFKGMMNGGYMIKAIIENAGLNMLRGFAVDQGYLRDGRSTIYECVFQLKAADDAEAPDMATVPQRAFVVALDATADKGKGRGGNFGFVAVDPVSWYLMAGDASGRAWRGKLSDVIKQVVGYYAPRIDLDIGETLDSAQNVWYMMRQDPKTFMKSLLEWSASITPKKTQLLLGIDDHSLRVREQAEIPSSNVGLYRYHVPNLADNIHDWRLQADNAMSVVGSKLVTQGISAVSGQILDSVMDLSEEKVFATDENTANKYNPDLANSIPRSFLKPPDGQPPDSPTAGWTAIAAVPEIYNGGELGQRYQDYIDGNARAYYLDLIKMVMRLKIRVTGHGIYYNTLGLGTDTFTLAWFEEDGVTPFFLMGKWLIIGFHHRFSILRGWYTDVTGIRLDSDAEAIEV